MKILIACEYSGKVRDAFRLAGHDAISCDLLPTDAPGPHIQGDVLPLLAEPWDMIIAFPPCTHLAVSGAKHFAAKRADGRQQQGIDLFMAFVARTVHVPRVAIENPVGIMSSEYRSPDQIVQPWMFGDPYTKTTCLWLKGLPILRPTQIVDRGPRHITKGGKSLPCWYNLPPSEDRAKIRSATFPGLAAAMAEQWSSPSLRLAQATLFQEATA